MRLFLAATMLLSYFAMPVTAQPDFDAVQIKTIHVKGPVYMLEGYGGNIGLSVGEDGTLVIDDQFAPLADKIKAAIAKLTDKPTRFVLNTHWHFDHTGGNEAFGESADIIAHENVRKLLSREETILGMKIPPLARHGLPVITFTDGLSLHMNGEDIRVTHIPGGHTDGDAVVFFTKSNVIHTGDIVTAGRYPFVDLDHGGSVQGMIKSVDKLLTMINDDTKIIPGHGPLAAKKDLITFREMMQDSLNVVRRGIKSGQSLEEIQKTGLPGKWKDWDKGFLNTDQWLALVHESLQKN